MERKKHAPLLIFLCVATYLCNLFDLHYTVHALEYIPGAYEKNPAMRWIMQWPELVVVYKFSLLPLGLYLLYRNRHHRLAVWGIYLCALCFGATVLGQLLLMRSWDWFF